MENDAPTVAWRETTPAPVQGDLDAMVVLAVRTASDALAKREGFQPFAVLLGDDRRPQLSWVDPRVSGPRPKAADLLPLLVSAAREQRGSLLGAGVVADTSIDGGDAIRVELEHRDGGPALVVVVPYRPSWVEGELSLGEQRVAVGTRRVWEQPAG